MPLLHSPPNPGLGGPFPLPGLAQNPKDPIVPFAPLSHLADWAQSGWVISKYKPGTKMKYSTGLSGQKWLTWTIRVENPPWDPPWEQPFTGGYGKDFPPDISFTRRAKVRDKTAFISCAVKESKLGREKGVVKSMIPTKKKKEGACAGVAWPWPAPAPPGARAHGPPACRLPPISLPG